MQSLERGNVQWRTAKNAEIGFTKHWLSRMRNIELSGMWKECPVDLRSDWNMKKEKPREGKIEVRPASEGERSTIEDAPADGLRREQVEG